MNSPKKLLFTALSATLAIIPLSSSAVTKIVDTSWACSTYAPAVYRESGWDRYRMYFGRNPLEYNVSTGTSECKGDKIYLSENFSNGITGWTTPTKIIDPITNGWGNLKLIHDPSIVQASSYGTWYLYFTGSERWDGNDNNIYVTSSANGVSNWSYPIKLSISNLPFPVAGGAQWGIGTPSIVKYNNMYYLYFTYKAQVNTTTTFDYIGLATSSTPTGTFIFNKHIVKRNGAPDAPVSVPYVPAPIVNDIEPANPDVRVNSAGKVILSYDTAWANRNYPSIVYMAKSDNPFFTTNTFNCAMMSDGDSTSSNSTHSVLGSSSILPNEQKMYSVYATGSVPVGGELNNTEIYALTSTDFTNNTCW